MGTPKTDAAESILKSDNAQQILDWLPPVYGEADTFLHLLQAVGSQLDEEEDWAERFRQEALPKTAEATLTYWEERYGIPSNPDKSLEERREAIMDRKRTRLPMNPHNMARFITNEAGLPAKVSERPGEDRFSILCNGYITPAGVENLKKKIDTYKPAHLVYDIVVAQLMEAALTTYWGIGVSMYQRFEVEVQGNVE